MLDLGAERQVCPPRATVSSVILPRAGGAADGAAVVALGAHQVERLEAHRAAGRDEPVGAVPATDRPVVPRLHRAARDGEVVPAELGVVRRVDVNLDLAVRQLGRLVGELVPDTSQTDWYSFPSLTSPGSTARPRP